ncbi:MAG: COG4315 family predicted lipoprotein [Solirubrobacterales bacterium]
MKTSNAYSTMAIGVIAAAALGLAACGGGYGDDSNAAGSAESLSVQSIDGTEVLVDSRGRALYSADQERGGKVLCTDRCTSIWELVPASDGNSASSDLDLGEVERADGATQLTYEGRPLYTFAGERAGELSGDGVVDSFGGTRFAWSAATASGETGSSGSAGSGGAYGAGSGY